MKTVKLAIAFLSFLLISASYSQTFTKSSLHYGIAAGLHSSKNTDGIGMKYSLGYQHEIWRDRLRIKAQFGLGQYNSLYIVDASEMNFQSLSLEGLLYFDILKIKSFSILCGSGLFFNYLSGLRSGNYNSETNAYIVPRWLHECNGGIYLGLGCRINPETKRVAFNIIPINFYLGFGMMEIHPSLEIDVKL